MRIDLKSRTGRALVAGGAVLMSSCSFTTRPQPMKQFFLPPSRAISEPAAEQRIYFGLRLLDGICKTNMKGVVACLAS